MSNDTMPRLQTPTQTKARVSVALDIEKKQALEAYAKGQNRSVHFVMLEIIDRALQEAKEETEYQEYIKNRVLASEKRLNEQGADNLTKEQVRANIKQFLASNK